MAGPSPRYVAAHMVLPRFFAERGGAALLDAIEAKDADAFIPVWMTAGFRFTPTFLYTTVGDRRVGVMTLPMPREPAEAYMAILVGSTATPADARMFLLEKAEPLTPSSPTTYFCSWAESRHLNHGPGPAFTGDLATDAWAAAQRALALVADAT